MIRSVCVFCGSSHGFASEYAETAKNTGLEIARRGWTLVYGGGNVGLMGVVADAVLSTGGKVIGVIPEALLARELGHTGLTKLHVVGTMHERKAMMADLSDGFIALPGGIGTFEEFFEILTWGQLGIHRKPCGLINVRDYYGPLLAMLDKSVEEGFLKPVHSQMILQSENAGELLSLFEGYDPGDATKWITRNEL